MRFLNFAVKIGLMNHWLLLVICLAVFGCQGTEEKEGQTEKQAEKAVSVKEECRNMTNDLQAEIMRELSIAMKNGGPEGAIGVCNEAVNGLAKQYEEKSGYKISRISMNNRNPNNNLKHKHDSLTWKKYARRDSENTLVDRIVSTKKMDYYYKPIFIGMQRCLTCHGSEEDIKPATKEKLVALYPKDKATGYKIGDFRGLWKVEIKK